jgi:nucleotide-binding universal stress UspA family protein
MNALIRSILHPTDLSPSSTGAFAHALRIALAAKSKLHVLHVLQDQVGEGWEHPHVRLRRLLVQWDLLDKNDPLEAIDRKLGVPIDMIMLDRQQSPADEIVHFLNRNACDLVVLATHGRDGLDHWLKGSVAETVFSRSTVPTLFIPPSARGFVDQVTGDFRLRRVLVPVDHSPMPYRAIEAAQQVPKCLTGADIAMHLLHIGSTAPRLDESKDQIVFRHGNVVQSILDVATEYDVDFICMPTAGQHGVLDALRGSTTQRVLRHAPCPLLAISAV